MAGPALVTGVDELLRVDRLGVCLAGADIVHDVSLRVERGQVVGLIGPNGAGKTTLIDAVTGFVRHQHGQVTFDGTVLDGLSPHRRARLGLARTFQSLALFDGLTVRQHLEAAASADRTLGSVVRDLFGPDPNRGVRVDECLDLLGLAPLAARRPDELGPGERRRVALGRALVTRPALVVLDEPAPGLDHDELDDLATALRVLRDAGVAVLLSDHHQAFVLDLCDIVHVLAGGRLIASGSPTQIREDPAVGAVYLGARG